MPEKLEQEKKLLKESQGLLDEVGSEGLSGIIAAALVKAKALGPRAGKALNRVTIRRVCRIYLAQGGDPFDLSDFATDILTECNHALKEQREEEEKRKKAIQAQKDADEKTRILDELDET